MFKKLALTAIAGTTLLAASSAFAHDGHWNRGHRWHGYHHPHRVVVVPRAPVVYAAPAPVFYAPPAPVVYAPPAPVVYAPPVYVTPRPTVVYHQPGLSIRVGF